MNAMRQATLAIVAAAAITAGTVGTSTQADAGCRGCAVGAGIAAGVIGAAIIGGAIANNRRHEYYEEHRDYGPPPDDDAVEYCMHRYRSYDPDSGTYMGYDGYRHPCP
jgi:hypothetical protein